MERALNFRSYNRMYAFIRRIVCPFVVRKFSFTGEKIPTGIGPRFILCNHNTDVDFMLISSMSSEPMDFVATETMMRMGPIARWAALKYRPILHDKGSKGVSTLKEITRRIKEGRSVLLFPEGNRSFDGRTKEVSDAIGKIAKMTGATIIIYKLTGGYLTTPRWGAGIRRGKMEGKISRVITPDELLKMSADDVLCAIREGIDTDAYREQEERRIRYKSTKRAQYLETLLFICPSCKKTGTLVSKGNELSCSCGYRLTLDEYGYLSDENKEEFSITSALGRQKELLSECLLKRSKEPLWQDEVSVSLLSFDHNVLEQRKSTLSAYHDHLMIGEKRLDLSDISSIDIVQRNRLSIHWTGSSEHYEILGDTTFNAVKYSFWIERSSA